MVPGIALSQQRAIPEQRGGPPTPETPHILVATFQSDSKATGVDVAGVVRRRLQDAYSAKALYVVPKSQIDATLKSSGYPPDSVLSLSDLMALGGQVHADEVLDAYATKSPEGVRIEARVLLRRASTILSQPLPPAMGKNAGDAAKELERHLADARKSLPAYRICENDLRAQKFDAAADNGRAVIQAYPNSTLGRLCVLSAFAYAKAAPDSIIRVAEEIVKLDSTNTIALSNAASAYRAKGNFEKYVEFSRRVMAVDPLNTVSIEAIIDDLVTTGHAEQAIPLVEERVKALPGDPHWLRKKMAVLLAAKRFRAAVQFSDTLATTDTASLTEDFFTKLGAAAALDSQPQLAAQIYTRGLKKFPNNADMWLANAQALARSNQPTEALVAAQRAVAIEPRIEKGNGYLYVLGLQVQLGQFDSAMVVTAPRAIEAGASKERVAATLVAVIAAAVREAQNSKARADWQRALKAATEVDAIAGLPHTKFYMGLSAVSIAGDAVTEAGELYKQLDRARAAAQRDLRAKACAAIKLADDNLTIGQINVPQGASVDREAAGQLMTAISGLSDYVSKAKPVLCR
jgi:tetratricopeptide (TPR) repeat protein